jgi:hypothetical protein
MAHHQIFARSEANRSAPDSDAVARCAGFGWQIAQPGETVDLTNTIIRASNALQSEAGWEPLRWQRRG